MTINVSPWYKQGWPWAIISIPFSAVVFGILMVTVAFQNPDDLVVDDYYKDGMAINERLTRDNNAARLGIHGRLVHSDDVRFHFAGASDSAIVFHMYHVVDQDKDKRIILYPGDESGSYGARDIEVKRSLSEAGIWYLEFEGIDENWRLRTRVQLPVDDLEIGGQ